MKNERKSNEQIGRAATSEVRRAVVIDIETVALDPTVEKGALSSLTGRVVCICMLVDDGAALKETTFAGEREDLILSDFWAAIRPGDVVVGHNVLDFDLRFLRQRSWILGIRPSRMLDTRKYCTGDVIDTLQLWTNWSGNKSGATLDALGVALGCGGKTSNGADVARWWAERDIESIKRYCRDDVRLAYRVFCRLTYREPRPIASDMQPMSAALVGATTATEGEEDVCLG